LFSRFLSFLTFYQTTTPT